MKWIGAAIAALVLAVPASAKGGPQPLDISDVPASDRQSSLWIEQQDDWPQPEDFIRNSVRPCVWSVNDRVAWLAGGYLDPGASTVAQACVVSDFNPVYATRFGVTSWGSIAPYGFFGVLVSNPALDVTVCYSPQNRCFTAEQAFCGRANYLPDDPALGDIEGSHGGRGVITTITLTVSNPTAKRIRNIRVDWGISSDVRFPAGCAGPQQENAEYPFAWTSS